LQKEKHITEVGSLKIKRPIINASGLNRKKKGFAVITEKKTMQFNHALNFLCSKLGFKEV
jgi:hypothetical protein